MKVEEVHERLKAIENIIESKNLGGEAEARINWCGEEMNVSVNGRERYDTNGYWSRSKTLEGPLCDVEELLDSAETWAYNLPGKEDRAIELMIQKLNEMAEKLPRGGSDVAARAWEEISKMLTSRAEALAKSGLPSPTSISSIAK